VGTPKTKSSTRRVAVRRSLLDKLDRGNKYLFVNTVGSANALGRHKIGTPGMMKINNFRTNVWTPRIEKLIAEKKLPPHKKVRLHDLRHTSASWLISMPHRRRGHRAGPCDLAGTPLLHICTRGLSSPVRSRTVGGTLEYQNGGRHG